MNYRPLGKTGLRVSEIGFGAWGIGGTANGSIAYGPTDDAESRKALKRAFDHGINFYDTADLYGYGHSEELLGETFKASRSDVVIASKVGFLNQSGDQDFSIAHIRRSLETSLERLQTDYLDLYQLHDPQISVLEQNPEILETLRAFRKEGKIRAYGISVRGPGDALTAVTKFDFSAVQVNFNMIDQRPLENGLMDICRDREVGVISRTPLCFGFLTGKYSDQKTFHSKDHRSRWSPQQVEVWANAYRLFRTAVPLNGQTEAQLALRYCLSYPAVSTVIPGMLLEGEVDENVGAAEIGPLPRNERDTIETIYKEHEFFIRA